MEDLLFAFNAVMPIVLLIALGYFLKRVGLVNKAALDTMNKLCFKVLLPIQLFINVYESSSIMDINLTLLLFIFISTLTIFTLGLFLVTIYVRQDNRKGVLLQGLFRSNYTIIGVALAISIAQSEGAKVAGLVTLVTIPLSNVLATIALIIFVEDKAKGNMLLKTLKKIVTNPLIIGVLLGIVCLATRAIFDKMTFRLKDLEFLYEPAKKIAETASPLALITLGGLFEFTSFRGLQKLVLTGVAGKLVVVPLLALSAAILFFDFTGAEYATLVAVYAGPVAVSSAVMAKEMNNDDVLANQMVVWTTILSSISLFVIVYLFRLMKIF